MHREISVVWRDGPHVERQRDVLRDGREAGGKARAQTDELCPVHLLAEVPGGAGAGPDLRAVRRHRREHHARRRVEEHLHGDVGDDQDDPGKHGRRLPLVVALDELQVDRRHLQDRRRDVARNQVTASAPMRRLGRRRHEIRAW